VERQEYEELRRLATLVAREAGAVDPELVADEAMERLLLAPASPQQTKAWLRTVTRRLVIDAHRRAEARPKDVFHAHAAEWEEIRGPSFRPTPSLIVRRRLAVERALQTLPARDRTLLLDWVDGWSWAELSERYELSVPVLQTTVSRIKRKLRERFPDVEQFELD
jgi:RNA polymerase sigma factor (sigma-70 family)